MDDFPTNYPTTKVLCLFRYWGRSEGRLNCYDDGIMIHVESADHILAEFTRAIGLKVRTGWVTGPIPRRWELMAYLPVHPFRALVLH